MKLAATQKILWKLITEPSGKVPASVARMVEGTPKLSALQRLTVYSDMYFWRNVGALQNDFPKLWDVLGDDGFAALTRRYLTVHRSQHHDLGQAGWQLAQFLKRSPLRGSRKDLADLAALEWARAGAYVAKDAVPLSLAEMAKIPPERFPKLKLKFVPSVRLVAATHDVAALWAAVEKGTRVPRIKRAKQYFVVWRKGFEVFHSRVDVREFKALSLAMAGKPIGAVLLPFGQGPRAAQAAFTALGSWVREEMVETAKTTVSLSPRGRGSGRGQSPSTAANT